MGFAWDQSLSVGFGEIDQQHQELFDRVNNLLTAASQGKGRVEIGKTLDFLGDYVVTHFGTEERLMAKTAYAGTVAHAAQHIEFAGAFQTLKKMFDDQGATSQLVVVTQKAVCGWLLNHIKKTDMVLGAFLNTRT